MATTDYTYASQGPFTPIKPSSRDSRLQSSPFSDYFTDDGRSADADDIPAPSPEKRQLLVRLNSLQSQLIHGDGESEQQTMDIVERKMHEIESQLNALHSQTRYPADMEDSGLFIEDDEEEEQQADGRKYRLGSRRASSHDQVTAEQKQAESDYLLLESQRVLQSVAKANEQLRQQLADTRSLHEQYARDLEARDQEIANLRTESETLRTDLSFDHSELLFMQLQFKALEMEIESLDHGAQRLETYAPEIKEDIQRVKRARIAEEMGKWRRDWEEVDARMGKRRQRYLAELENGGILEDAQDQWYVETLKQSGEDGKVQSITIQRVDDGSEGQKDSDAEVRAGTNEVEVEEEIESDADEPQHTASEREYASISTQTDSLPDALFEQDTISEQDFCQEHDCAITTSSEDNQSQFADDDGDDDDIDDRKRTIGQAVGLVKTAWEELWEGLSAFAGMAEERFE